MFIQAKTRIIRVGNCIYSRHWYRYVAFLLNNLIEPNLWISKIAFYGLGLIAIGLGTSIYLYANFAPIPVDRLTLVLQTITRLSILFTRTIIYLVFLFAAIIFNGPIGIGTLLTICLGGLILNYFMPLIHKALDRLLQHTTADSAKEI